MEEFFFAGHPLVIRRKPYRRRLSIRVEADASIRVTCGLTLTRDAIEGFLRKHADWISRTQAKYREAAHRFPQPSWVEGCIFIFEGQQYQLQIDTKATAMPSVALGSEHLIYTGPTEEMRRAVRDFYRKRGIIALRASLERLVAQTGLTPKRVSFRCQRTRWGSCSSSGQISLNWRLSVMPPSTLDYVVLHELTHLEHPDHSRDFWASIERHVPHHRIETQRLRELQHHADFLLNI